jgi:hypothetical protein
VATRRPKPAAAATAAPQTQLDAFLDRFTPEVAALTRRALGRMRKLTKGALELVYDNYNALVIGFGPTERASTFVFSIAVYPRYPTLFFARGAKLPDPTRRLRGGGTSVRHIVIDDIALFDAPDVQTLIATALARTPVPLDPKQKRRLIIRSISPRRRARRPAG